MCIRDSNCTIRNCYNANASVTAYHSNPEQEDHTAAQAGGIAATLSNGSTCLLYTSRCV